MHACGALDLWPKPIVNTEDDTVQVERYGAEIIVCFLHSATDTAAVQHAISVNVGRRLVPGYKCLRSDGKIAQVCSVTRPEVNRLRDVALRDLRCIEIQIVLTHRLILSGLLFSEGFNARLIDDEHLWRHLLVRQVLDHAVSGLLS